jgi:thymidine kinase
MDMVDKDGTPALFSKRVIADDEQISVGAIDKYIAVSRKNYLRDL